MSKKYVGYDAYGSYVVYLCDRHANHRMVYETKIGDTEHKIPCYICQFTKEKAKCNG